MTFHFDEQTPTVMDKAPLTVHLHETDEALAPVCRQIETQIAENNVDPHAAHCDIDVELVRDFASHTLLRGKAAYATQLAIHKRPQHSGERPRVLVNWPLFELQDASVQRAILAHEVAHGVRALAGPPLPLLEEEFETDCLACRWGFSTELLASREADYGHEYVKALNLLIDARNGIAAWNNWYVLNRALIKKHVM